MPNPANNRRGAGRVTLFDFAKVDVADIFDVISTISGFPKNKCANRIAFQDRIQKLCCLLNFPNEVPLELWLS